MDQTRTALAPDSALKPHSPNARRNRIAVIALAVCCAAATLIPLAAEEPERPRSFAIQGAKLVPVSGAVIEQGTIVLNDGLITAIGRDVQVPPGAWVIEGKGLTVYPGLIDAMSSVGLPNERDRRRAGGQGNQGDLPISAGPEDRPATKTWSLAADQFDAANDRVKAWRDAGFTTAVVAPMDGIFPGQAAVMNLAGDRASEMTVHPQVALVINIGYSGGYRGFPGSLMGYITYVRQLFHDAEHYRAAWAVYREDPSGLERPAYDRTLAPLVEARSERRPVLYPGDLAKEIHRALDLSKELDFPVIVYGVHEGYEAAAALAERKAAAVVNLEWPEKERNADPDEEEPLRVLRLRDRAAGTPAAFEKAGVKFAFYSGEIRSAADILPKVRTAIEKGLSPEAALRALTLSAAEIYGVEDRLGSLDNGKIANLVVTEGDLFAEKPKLKMVFVDGQKYDIRPPREDKLEDKEQQGETP